MAGVVAAGLFTEGIRPNKTKLDATRLPFLRTPYRRSATVVGTNLRGYKKLDGTFNPLVYYLKRDRPSCFSSTKRQRV